MAHIFVLEITNTKPYNGRLAGIKPFRNPVRTQALSNFTGDPESRAPVRIEPKVKPYHPTI
jgi:hypothetical protein